MVIGERRDAGSQSDLLRPFRGRRDEHLRRGDDLATGRMVLADPRLVVAEPVQSLDQFQVALEGERWVLVGLVERGQEDAESHELLQTLWTRRVHPAEPQPTRSTWPPARTDVRVTAVLGERPVSRPKIHEKNRTTGGSQCRRFGAILPALAARLGG